MKKSVFGRKLGRDKNERQALFRGLVSALILKDRIETTEAKAKAVRPQVEKLVTKALAGGNSSMKVISQGIYPYAFDRFVNDVAPRFKDRKGGYTRIIKIGTRLGDQSPTVILEWVEMPKAVAVLGPDAKVELKEKTKKVEVKKEKKVAVKRPVTKNIKAITKKVKGKGK